MLLQNDLCRPFSKLYIFWTNMSLLNQTAAALKKRMHSKWGGHKKLVSQNTKIHLQLNYTLRKIFFLPQPKPMSVMAYLRSQEAMHIQTEQTVAPRLPYAGHWGHWPRARNSQEDKDFVQSAHISISICIYAQRPIQTHTEKNRNTHSRMPS